MPRPNFVYFDLGNVLCFFDHGISTRQMAEVAQCDSATIRRLVYESDLEHRYETGLITGEEFVAEIAKRLGRPLPTNDMLEAASAMFEPNVAILPVLETIRDLNIPMGLLSNTNKAHWEWIYRQQYSIVHGWFDPIILSYEVQAMKPGKTIYEVAAKQAGFPAEQIFFTDDRLDNIEGAKAMSWQVSQFIDADSLMTIVKTWG